MPPKPPANQRWKDALQTRNMEREQLRANSFRQGPLTAAGVVPVPAPGAGGQMTVQRGTRMHTISAEQASATTQKSWQARKEKYGKKGRASVLTFSKTHKRLKS